jgi:hypothetical protein
MRGKNPVKYELLACTHAHPLCTVVCGAFPIFCSLTSPIRRPPVTPGLHLRTNSTSGRRSPACLKTTTSIRVSGGILSMGKLQRGAAHQAQMTANRFACSRKFYQRYVPPPVQAKQGDHALTQGSSKTLSKPRHYIFDSKISNRYLDYSPI